MLHSMLSASRAPQRSVVRLWAARALAAAALTPVAALPAALPAPPQTFDSSYVAPRGAILRVAAGQSLQAALNNAKPGDTIVLQAGATFRGPFKLPNKPGTGWIYVVSSHLSYLPPPGTRVSPANATNMPKILAPNGLSALNTVANSHHFRFVGIEFAPAPGTTLIYEVVAIGNSDASPATLPHHIVFDRCYVHGNSNSNDRRGIEMDGAYVAVVDSYISGFQWADPIVDTQGLWAFNTTGPLQIRNNYIEADSENVMFGGADSHAAALVPTSIEIRNNHFYKPLSFMRLPTQYNVKNLLEFKAARRVLVTGNTFENNPAKSQNGFALLITPANQGGKAPWTVTSDIAIVDNRFINVGSGFNILGRDNYAPSLMTQRILVRDNIVGVTGLNGADGRAFQFINGGSDYTVDHNTIINTASPPAVCCSDVGAAGNLPKINNFVFTNNLSTPNSYGFFGSGVGEGTRALNTYFTNWTFSRNVLVSRPAGAYPAGNFFPASVTAVRFVNFAGGNYAAGNYALAANSPYKHAGTDGMDIGADDPSLAL